MEELALSRQGFEEVLLAKDKDLLAKDQELKITKVYFLSLYVVFVV